MVFWMTLFGSKNAHKLDGSLFVLDGSLFVFLGVKTSRCGFVEFSEHSREVDSHRNKLELFFNAGSSRSTVKVPVVPSQVYRPGCEMIQSSSPCSGTKVQIIHFCTVSR